VLLFTALEGLPRRPRAVAIGTFDGLHIGHQQVIGAAVATAREGGLASSVLTFSGHPAAVLDPSHRPRLLTPLPVKVQLIDALGPDELVLLPFDRALAATTADDFCQRILVAALQAQVVVVGENFTYGAGGAAGAAELRAAGETLGFTTTILPLATEHGAPISSTRIRALLHAGKLEEVRAVLGRPPAAAGLVAGGFQRGRTLGVPTANLEVATDAIFPGRGVYAARAQVDGSWYRAAVNIGHNPTFQSRAAETAHVTIEAHLLGFEGTIYGRHIHVDFLHKLRDERRFASVDELVAQMQHDIAATTALADRAFAEVGL
jgi:riboflavin kinase / FMN adenylyltransferase